MNQHDEASNQRALQIKQRTTNAETDTSLAVA